MILGTFAFAGLGLAMAGGLRAEATLAGAKWLLPCFLVQVASMSFWRRLAGFQPAGIAPCSIRSFSPRRVCCVGAGTRVASMI